ncbi:hypothetical protein TrLO_g8674 [Triparma laevis f. longispina]|uniref:Uncharacterized protein n=1 Tax=Triparma laevis f. longispina TaxID=1714387 RepID=A0A9W6Z4S2_9STRA|nr:hypothetical protein TrLO_g8674 [Triparma laevis f. longispina]
MEQPPPDPAPAHRSKHDKQPPPPFSPYTLSTLPSILHASLPNIVPSSLLPSATSPLLKPLLHLHPLSSTHPHTIRTDLASLPLPALLTYSSILPPLPSYLFLVHLERHLRHLFFHTTSGVDGSLYNSAKSPSLLKVFNVSQDIVECETNFGDDIELKINQCTYIIFDDSEIQNVYDQVLIAASKTLFSVIENQKNELKLIDIPEFQKIQPCVDIYQLGLKLILRILNHLNSYTSILLKVKSHVGLNHYSKALKVCDDNIDVDSRVEGLKDKVVIWEDRFNRKDRKLAKALGSFVAAVMEKNEEVIK